MMREGRSSGDRMVDEREFLAYFHIRLSYTCVLGTILSASRSLDDVEWGQHVEHKPQN